MSRSLWTMLLLGALASCGAAKDTSMNETVTRFALASSDISEGQPIPQLFTCDGEDRSPQLSWDEPPAGTKSLALLMDDPDARSGTFRHWGAYDIPPTTRTIAQGEKLGKEAVNGSGASGYKGPCPPPGDGLHHYHFKLYALDVDRLALPADATVERVEAEARKHQLGMAELTGTFERK